MQPNEPEAAVPNTNNEPNPSSDAQAASQQPPVITPAPETPQPGDTPSHVIEPTASAQSSTFPSPANTTPDIAADSVTSGVTPVASTIDEGGTVGQPIVSGQSATVSTPKRRNKKLLLAGGILGALIVLGGASAAAYFGYVVPNKPENVLKNGILNSLKQHQFSFDGTVNVEAADSSKQDATPATKITLKGFADSDKQTFDSNVSVTVMGITVPGEVRYVDKTAYLKLGDLSTLKSLADAYNPGYGAVLDKVSNQWVEIDSTLLKQAKLDCVLDANVGLTQSDLQALSDGYQKNAFVTLNSSSNDTVNGKAATKFDLTIDNDKLSTYLKGSADNLSFIKKYRECSGNQNPLDFGSPSDGGRSPFTLWVDKASHRVTKLEFASTPQDAQKDNVKGSLSMVIGYEAQSVEKPADAKPIMSLLGELMQASGQNGTFDSSSLMGSQTGSKLGASGVEDLFGGAGLSQL